MVLAELVRYYLRVSNRSRNQDNQDEEVMFHTARLVIGAAVLVLGLVLGGIAFHF